MRRGRLEREFYPLPHVGKPDLLRMHGSSLHGIDSIGSYQPYSTSVRQSNLFIRSPIEAATVRPPKQQSEPLDLSKSSISKPLSTDSKLERILTSGFSTTSCRKRPYSCLINESQNTKYHPASSTTTVRNHQPNSVTAISNHQQRPVTINMEEAADNPVVMVELATGSELATSEQISCALIKMMSKVFSMSQFTRLSEDDKVALLHNSWHRLMLWCLASDNFTFKVSTLSHQSASTSSSTASLRCPSMAFVKGIAVFVKKFTALSVSPQEFSLLFGITLFHTGKPSVAAQTVDENRKYLMKQLQSLVQSSGSDSSRYTDLLLCLPFLYSIDEDMFENLFCGKKFCNGDIKILLKDAVKQVTKNISSM